MNLPISDHTNFVMDTNTYILVTLMRLTHSCIRQTLITSFFKYLLLIYNLLITFNNMQILYSYCKIQRHDLDCWNCQSAPQPHHSPFKGGLAAKAVSAFISVHLVKGVITCGVRGDSYLLQIGNEEISISV